MPQYTPGDAVAPPPAKRTGRRKRYEEELINPTGSTDFVMRLATAESWSQSFLETDMVFALATATTADRQAAAIAARMAHFASDPPLEHTNVRRDRHGGQVYDLVNPITGEPFTARDARRMRAYGLHKGELPEVMTGLKLAQALHVMMRRGVPVPVGTTRDKVLHGRGFLETVPTRILHTPPRKWEALMNAIDVLPADEISAPQLMGALTSLIVNRTDPKAFGENLSAIWNWGRGSSMSEMTMIALADEWARTKDETITSRELTMMVSGGAEVEAEYRRWQEAAKSSPLGYARPSAAIMELELTRDAYRHAASMVANWERDEQLFFDAANEYIAQEIEVDNPLSRAFSWAWAGLGWASEKAFALGSAAITPTVAEYRSGALAQINKELGWADEKFFLDPHERNEFMSEGFGRGWDIMTQGFQDYRSKPLFAGDLWADQLGYGKNTTAHRWASFASEAIVGFWVDPLLWAGQLGRGVQMRRLLSASGDIREYSGLGIFGMARAIANPRGSSARFRAVGNAYVRPRWVEMLGMDPNTPMPFREWIVRSSLKNPNMTQLLPRGIGLGKAGLDRDYVTFLRTWLLEDRNIRNFRQAIPQEVFDDAWDALEVVAGLKPQSELGRAFSRLADTGAAPAVRDLMNASIRRHLLRLKPRFTKSGEMMAQSRNALERAVRAEMIQLAVSPGRVSQLVRRAVKLIKAEDWAAIRAAEDDVVRRELAGVASERVTNIVGDLELENIARRTEGLPTQSWAERFGEIRYQQRFIPTIGNRRFSPAEHMRELYVGLRDNPWFESRMGRWVSGIWERAPRPAANIEEHMAPEMLGTWLRAWNRSPEDIASIQSAFVAIRAIKNDADRAVHYKNFVQSLVRDNMATLGITPELTEAITRDVMQRYSYSQGLLDTFYGWRPETRVIVNEAGETVGREATGNLVRITRPRFETELLNTVLLPDPKLVRSSIRRFMGDVDVLKDVTRRLFDEKAISVEDPLSLTADDLATVLERIAAERNTITKAMRAGGKAHDQMRLAADTFRNAWVDAVLLRPGWALKVLPDENFRAFIVLHDMFDRIRSINYFANPGFRIPFTRGSKGLRRTTRGGRRIQLGGEEAPRSLFAGRQIPVHPKDRWVETEVPVWGTPDGDEFAESVVQSDLFRGDSTFAGIPNVEKARPKGMIGPLIYTTEGSGPAASFYALDQALPEEAWVRVPFANRRPGESFTKFLERWKAQTGLEEIRVARVAPKMLRGEQEVLPTEVGIVPSRPPDRTIKLNQKDMDRIQQLVDEDGVTPRGALRIVATEKGYGVKNWNLFAHEFLPETNEIRMWALPIGEGYLPNVTVMRGNARNPFHIDDFDGDVKRTVTPAALRKGVQRAAEEADVSGRWPRRTQTSWHMNTADVVSSNPDLEDVQIAQQAWDQLMGIHRQANSDFDITPLYELENFIVERIPETREVVGVTLLMNIDDTRLINSVLSDPRQMRQIKTNRQLYDTLTLLAYGRKDVTNQILRYSGFDAITHIGGRTSNYPEHRVWGWFDEGQLRPGGSVSDQVVGTRKVGRWVEPEDEYFEMPVEGLIPDDPAAIQGMTEDTAFRSMLARRNKISRTVAKQHLTATHATDARAFFEQWSLALDHKYVQSPLAMQALRHLVGLPDETGKVVTRERLLRWVEENDATFTLRRLGESSEDFVDNTLADVEYNVLGNRIDKYGRDTGMAEAILRRETSPEDLKRLTYRWAPERYPEIEFNNLDDALRFHQNKLTRARHDLYKYLMRLPSGTLNRQPLWKALFTREVERRMHIAFEQGERFSDEEVQAIMAATHPIGEGAKSYAINRSLSYMFSYMDHSRFAEAHRLMFPFFSAYQEQFSVWSRLLWEHPSALARVRYMGDLAADSGLFEVDEETGEVKIGSKPLVFLTWAATLFHPIGLYAGVGALLTEKAVEKSLELVNPTLRNAPDIEWMVSANALNIFLQSPMELKIGDVSFMAPTPGVGPLAAPFVDWLTDKYPASWPGKARLMAWAAHNGSGINLLPSSWTRILSGTLDIDSRQLESTKNHMLDLLAMSSPEHLDPKEAEEQAERMARQFLAFRGLMSMLSASAPQPNMPGQALRDEYQALIDAGNSPDTAASILQDRYPNRPDILLPTIAYTAWTAAPQAIIDGELVQGAYTGAGPPANVVVSQILADPAFEEAARRHPEFAFFLIPSEFRSSDIPFDYQAYSEQLAQGLREYKPAAYFNENGELLGGRLYELQRQQGWAEAHVILAGYEVRLNALGPDPSTAAEREVRQKYLVPHINEIKEEFPAFAKEWDSIRTERDPFLNRNIDIIKQVIEQPLWRETAWANSMREYFAWRDPVYAKMYQRNISWDSNAAEGIRAEHEELVNRLTRQYGDDFTIAYNTWLQDDLEFGMQRRNVEARKVPEGWINRFQIDWDADWEAAQDLAFGGYSSPEEQKRGFAKMRALALRAYDIEERSKNLWPDAETSLNPIERMYLELNPTQRKEAALRAAITPYVFLNKYQRRKVLNIKTTGANEELWLEVEKMKLDVYEDLVGMNEDQERNRWEQFNQDIDRFAAAHPGFRKEMNRNHVWGWTLWKVLPRLKPKWYEGKTGEAWDAIETVTRGMRKVFRQAEFVDEEEFENSRQIFIDYVNEWRDYSPDFDRQWTYLQSLSGDNLYEFLVPELWWVKV